MSVTSPSFGSNWVLVLDDPTLDLAPAGTVAVPGDADGDGDVDVDDFARTISSWGPHAAHPADVNGDCMVDQVDLSIVLANWGTGTS